MAETFFLGAMQVANGDENEARRIIMEDVKFQLDGELENRMKEALQYRPCRFTSVHMCALCAANDRTPAKMLSKQYAQLALKLDTALFGQIDDAWKMTEEAVSKGNQ
jgi:hypothetical protein